MADVSPELLPEHPIDRLTADETDRDAGYVRGEVLGYRCRECANMDETLREIVHDGDCRLAGETLPTGYNRRLDKYDHTAYQQTTPAPARPDGGETRD